MSKIILLFFCFWNLIQINAQQLKRAYIDATLEIIPDSVMIGDSITISLSFVNTTTETIMFYPNSLISLNHRYVHEELVFFTSVKPCISLYLNVENPYTSIMEIIAMSAFKNPVVLKPNDKCEMKYKIVVSEDFFYAGKMNHLGIIYHGPLEKTIKKLKLHDQILVSIYSSYNLWIEKIPDK